VTELEVCTLGITIAFIETTFDGEWRVIAPRASDAPPAFGYSPPSVSSAATVANLEVARRYLAALEAGTIGDELAAFFAPDVEQIEFPNRLVPTGGRRGLAEMLEGARRGQDVLREQRYQVEHAFADGNVVVLEVLWVGTLAIDRGPILAGQELRAHFAVVLELQGGRITAQRYYDCFEPF
jgi:ketosteroid isomerase-like protein